MAFSRAPRLTVPVTFNSPLRRSWWCEEARSPMPLSLRTSKPCRSAATTSFADGSFAGLCAFLRTPRFAASAFQGQMAGQTSRQSLALAQWGDLPAHHAGSERIRGTTSTTSCKAPRASWYLRTSPRAWRTTTGESDIRGQAYVFRAQNSASGRSSHRLRGGWSSSRCVSVMEQSATCHFWSVAIVASVAWCFDPIAGNRKSPKIETRK